MKRAENTILFSMPAESMKGRCKMPLHNGRGCMDCPPVQANI